MVGRLFLLFTVVTFAEMFLLLQFAQWMGFWWTVVLVLATGFAGAWLARLEGLRALARLRTELQEGRMPGGAIIDGLCILVAAALLMTPGVLTDVVGFLLLFPPARIPLKAALLERSKRWLAEGSVTVLQGGMGASAFHGFDVHRAQAERADVPVSEPSDPSEVRVVEAEVVDDGRVFSPHGRSRFGR